MREYNLDLTHLILRQEYQFILYNYINTLKKKLLICQCNMDEILYVGSRSESMGHFNKKKIYPMLSMLHAFLKQWTFNSDYVGIVYGLTSDQNGPYHQHSRLSTNLFMTVTQMALMAVSFELYIRPR